MKIKFKVFLILKHRETMEINGYENYLIHEDGTVYSKITKKFLKPHIRKGYYRVGLTKNKKQKNFSINRLVAEHYIPNPENKPEVDHIDDDPLNNNVNNLQWLTHQENIDKRKYPTNTGYRYINYREKQNVYDLRVAEHRLYLRGDDYELIDVVNIRDAILGKSLSPT